jgi:glycosyltransferase involved in cell wall biosynthesis
MDRMHRVAMLLENNPYPQDIRVRREAESLVAAGHEVCVYAPRAPGQPRRESVAGVRIRRFPLPAAAAGRRGFVAEYAVAAIRLHAAAIGALARRATVLHLHNPPDILFPAAFAARALGRRVVFDHHDLFPELVEAKFGASPLVPLAGACERLTFLAADHVLAANESHRDVACTRGRKLRRAVTVVRNGPRAADLAEPGGRPGALEDPHLVYVGAVSDQDGAEALPRVLGLLEREHGLPGARVTIVGDGDARAAVEAAARAEGVDDRVSFTGWVEADQVPALIRSADICVDPAPATALNNRSTMIKIAEYLAAAKPVVAFDLLETQRTVGDGALLARPDDVEAFAAAVARLAGDAGERSRVAELGRARAEALTWEHSERALLDAYAAL